ncbi:hypothetical protein V6N11_068307 [Hibiscus sabdariffa]|uniref:Uncharacterized protein n=1 Tax=Hibiscus sabdariffa TaxID=183260 RepID=A0ABR1Z6I6_9ROSI
MWAVADEVAYLITSVVCPRSVAAAGYGTMCFSYGGLKLGQWPGLEAEAFIPKDLLWLKLQTSTSSSS